MKKFPPKTYYFSNQRSRAREQAVSGVRQAGDARHFGKVKNSRTPSAPNFENLYLAIFTCNWLYAGRVQGLGLVVQVHGSGLFGKNPEWLGKQGEGPAREKSLNF